MGCSCVKAWSASEAEKPWSKPSSYPPASPPKSAAHSLAAGAADDVGAGSAGVADSGDAAFFDGWDGACASIVAEDHWEQVSAWAWGRGAAFGAEGPRASPAELPVKGRSIRGLGASWEQTLLVAGSGALWAAGENSAHCLFEERSEGTQQAGRVDLLELEGQRVEAVAGGRTHLVAILEEGGRVLSWGKAVGQLGQLGHGGGSASAAASPTASPPGSPKAAPASPAPDASQSPLLASPAVAAASSPSGSSLSGAIVVAPRAVALPAPRMLVRQIACGEAHTLVLTVAGTVFAFGDNAHGALGLGGGSAAATGAALPRASPPASPGPAGSGCMAVASTSAPTPVDGGALRAAPVRAVATGARHSLALTLGGEVVVWGAGEHGQLGLGDSAGADGKGGGDKVVATPTLLPGLPRPARHVAGGGQHSAIIISNGVCLLAGDNRYGQLAQDPVSLPHSRFLVAAPGSWRAVALGSAHTLLLSGQGLVHSCGRCDQGQLGTGSLSEAASQRLQRVALPADVVVFGLAAGPEHGVALARATPAAAASPAQQAMASDDDDDDANLEVPAEPTVASPWPPHTSVASPSQVCAPAAPLTGGGGGSPITPAGVCSTAKFGGLQVPELLRLVDLASGSEGGTKDELVKALSLVFAQPPLLNASFCFPGLERQRIDCEGLLAIMSRVWSPGFLSEGQRTQLRNAAMQGLERWAGDSRTWKESPPSLLRAEQVRGFVALLLSIESPLNASGGASPRHAGASAEAESAFLLVARVVAVVAALPTDGRSAFIQIIVDDVSSALRTIFVPRMRSFCNAAIRRGSKERNLPSSVWEGLLVLDFLAQANTLAQQRLQAELGTELDIDPLAGASLGQQPQQPSGPQPTTRRPGAVLGVLSRSGSKLGNLLTHGAPSSSSAAKADEQQAASAAASSAALLAVLAAKGPEAPVPPEDFELEALAEGVVPPDVEFALFIHNAKSSVPAREELLRLRPHDERLQCFTAHRHVLPAAFLRRVLHVENHYRQALQQQQGLQDTVLAAMAGQLRFDRNGGLAIDQSKFFFHVNVRRDHLLEDTLEVLQDAAPADLQKQLKVTFRGEEGQDAGGVSREFFRLLGEQLFDLRSELFDRAVADEARVLWPDRSSPRDPVDFWMLGVVLGLAVYNSLPGLDAHFPVCVFRKLRGEPVGLDDLQEVQPAVAASMRRLLSWEPEATSEDAEEVFVSTFPLDFTVSFEDETGTARSEELKPGGKDIAVTLANRGEFVSLYCTWVLTQSIVRQFEPFRKGFGRVCQSPLLEALTGDELARIVMGESDIELERLRPKAKYEGFTTQDQRILWFWEVLQELSPNHRRLFLSFATGSDRSPVGGLGEVRLIVQRGSGGDDRLPQAHTCFNTLLLPTYTSKEALRKALLMAIENTEGFGLE